MPSRAARLFAAGLLVIPAASCAAGSSPPTVRVAGPERVDVLGLRTEELDRDEVLTIRVASADPSGPPMLGEVRVEGDLLTFVPRFPLRTGVEYQAIVRTDEGPVVVDFTLPEPAPGPPTVVTAVHPTRSELPENLLKLYVRFSAPMSRGEAWDRIRLLEADGRAVELPFLELDEELWDASGTRLTLLLDPGRIKRGLKPREDLGPALRNGGSYELVIDAAFVDADGRPLAGSYTKRFTVGAVDRVQPDPEHWLVEPSGAGTRGPLAVTFREPLDHALLQRALTVWNAAGEHVHGEIVLADRETRWLLIPKEPWAAGRYVLRVDTTLEDLAGNSVAQPFERRLDRWPSERGPAHVELGFQVR